jgi:hypothetical protein
MQYLDPPHHMRASLWFGLTGNSSSKRSRLPWLTLFFESDVVDDDSAVFDYALIARHTDLH